LRLLRNYLSKMTVNNVALLVILVYNAMS